MSPEELVEYGVAIATRPFGDRSANIEESVAALTQALDRLPAAHRYLRGYAEYQLGMSLQERLAGSARDNLAAAFAAYERCVAALDGLDSMEASDVLGMALGNLSSLSMAGGEVESGIAYAERSLRHLDKEFHPRAWGVSQQNLGAGYQARETGDRAANLRRAVAAYDAALTVRPADGPEPVLHQRTMMARRHATTALARLGGPGPAARRELPAELVRAERAAHAYQQTGDPALLDTAIEAYSAALSELDESEDPDWWGSATNNLASCYARRRSGPDDVERAIAGYTAALRVRTRTADPLRWATTQASLALAYLNRKMGDELDNARAAVAAGENALVILNQVNTRQEWLGAVHNLGLAYVVLSERAGGRGDLADLSRGISLLETSAANLSGDPVQDRQLHFHLARAYQAVEDLAEVDRLTRIEARGRALRHLEILRELSRDEPAQWRTMSDTLVALAQAQASERDPVRATEEFIAVTEASLESLASAPNAEAFLRINTGLGAAYMRRLTGDPGDNVRAAIIAYERALSVAEPGSVRLAEIHRGLGDAYRAAADTETARSHYRAALAGYADSDRHDSRAAADVFAQLYASRTRRGPE
ncbi:ATP-binding protein [Hamadaea tsunoensis]|uniref:hypothetical protein n=1 Tax=Hamadaea tsunoensis TaxID=53368 RepID=UPI0004295704|nr:hypothetical protein [Hamadaea tsunoensis]